MRWHGGGWRPYASMAVLGALLACSGGSGQSAAPTAVPASQTQRVLVPPTTPVGATTTPTTLSATDAVYAAEPGGTAPCTSSQLVVGLGRGLAALPTGQNSLALTLTNTSASTCELSGYPAMKLLDERGDPLPFDYRRGGGQVVTASPAAPVELGTGRTAYVTISKYRCDLGTLDMPTAVEITPPGADGALSLSMPIGQHLGYCGPGDPGSTVVVSPVEPTERDTLFH